MKRWFISFFFWNKYRLLFFCFDVESRIVIYTSSFESNTKSDSDLLQPWNFYQKYKNQISEVTVTLLEKTKNHE